LLEQILPPLDRTPPSRAPELMDRQDCDLDDLRQALDGLARAHRAFGGHRMVAGPLLRRLAGRRPGPLRLLDVGTGGGDLAAGLSRRLRDRGWSPRLTLADLHPRTIRIARRRWRSNGSEADAPSADGAAGAGGVGPRTGEAAAGASIAAGAAPADFVRLDARRLPFPDGAFDLAVSSTMLHHLARDDALAFLREMDRVASGRWLVTDLRRSRLALAAVRLLAATLWRRNPLPRRDGPISVRRAFTPGELRSMLARADLTGARVDGRWPVRLRIRGRGLTGDAP
jgi:ubiquinone/menaquinone biosynthesis C-methylase UbiE